MLSLIYSSVATRQLDAADLTQLLEQSRNANARTDVTGMLLFRNGGFPTDHNLVYVPGYRATFDDLETHDGEEVKSLPALRELIRWFQPRVS
ncbi:BLUF domain-containing protein [Bacillus sp. S34]|nr:BLUF domain-containing protein [Bacillus sp. S34]